ncbi:tetratricopeptide repeat protein [Candidatus Magnetominusculus dajiuhuensis]|uniref:tetratricopeptide repeat protein n=1 Tax=Candidatus Magnetominusculus dajiuhuensis TaxID=3137712 RepID=UPI003B43A541
MRTTSKNMIVAAAVIVSIVSIKVGFSSGSPVKTDSRQEYTHKEETVVSTKSVKKTERPAHNEKSSVTSYINSKLTPDSSVSDKIELSNELYKNGNVKEAKEIILSAVTQSVATGDVMDIEDFKLLMAVYFKNGEIEQYYRVIDSIPDSYPLKDKIITEAATFYNDNGYANAAYEVLCNALNKNPNDAYIRYAFANTLSLQGRNEEAVQEYVNALSIADNPNGYFELGKLLLKMGKQDLAHQQFEKVVSISSNYDQEIAKLYEQQQIS